MKLPLLNLDGTIYKYIVNLVAGYLLSILKY